MRRTALGVLALIALAIPLHAEPAPRSTASLYVRGLKDVSAVLAVVRQDLGARAPDEPALLVILVDPWPRTARAVVNMAPAVRSYLAVAPSGSRVVVAPVGGPLPPLDGPPQDTDAVCKALAAKPIGGARNLLGDVRRVARTCTKWSGPRHILLLAAIGTGAEEETERTLDALRRHDARLSVVAGEAAFAQPWRPPPRPEGFVMRRTGHPDRRRDTLYASCEVPFPDTPASFDLALAPTTFRLTPEHKAVRARFRLPSGFGHYHLARLCRETGGRYLLHGFTSGKGGMSLTYSYGLLRLFEPDLRSRAEILADVSRRPLARALFRVWGRLADPGCGVIRVSPPIVASGGRRMRAGEESAVTPNRALRLTYTSKGQAFAMAGNLRKRCDAVDEALVKLDRALGVHRAASGGRVRLGDHRWVAQVDLMRLQLLRVRFHMGEILAAIRDLRNHGFRNVTISLRAQPLYRGTVPVRGMARPDNPAQIRILEDVLAETARMEKTYAGTPWGYMARLGQLHVYVPVFRPKGDSNPVARSADRDDPTEEAKPRPKPKPVQPGSSGGGATTGGD